MPSIPTKVIELTKGMPQFEKYFEDAARALSEAFITDPITLPALGVSYEANPELHDEYNRTQLRVALTGAGRVFVALVDTDGAERLAGAAIWYEPGRQFLDDDEQLGYWKPFSDTLKPEVQSWWQEVMLPRYEQLTQDGLGDGVKKASLHLQILGVLPEYRQKGTGRALAKHMLEQDNFREVASCLETCKDVNLLFYNSLGYQVKSEVLMPSPLGDFMMWCLHREPCI